VTVTAPDDQLSLVIGRGGQNARLAAKLTGFRITVKSASGQVASKVTGKEEYEIDTFKGLEPETRSLLVDYKLTTLGDLERFVDRWQAFEISDEQKAILNKKVLEYKQELLILSEKYKEKENSKQEKGKAKTESDTQE